MGEPRFRSAVRADMPDVVRLGFALEFSYEGFYASVWRQGCRLHLSCGMPTPRDQTAVEREERMPYGTEFYVRDPDGYILGFVQPAD